MRSCSFHHTNLFLIFASKIFISLFVLIFFACQPDNGIEARNQNASMNAMLELRKSIESNQLNKIEELLTIVYNDTLFEITTIVEDSLLYSLIKNPETRAFTRASYQKYTKARSATMVHDTEPGIRIHVIGTIRAERDNSVIPDAIIELAHADDSGFYFEEKSLWNPRIFTCLKTDQNGNFEIYTVRPGTYLDDEGNLAPSHIHFSTHSEGYRNYSSEFTFEDDSTFQNQGNVDGIPVALRSSSGRDYIYEVEIILQSDN